MPTQWYYLKNGNQVGPLSSKELKQLADSGSILPSDYIMKEGVEKWRSASSVKNLFSPESVTNLPQIPFSPHADAEYNGFYQEGGENNVNSGFDSKDSVKNKKSCNLCHSSYDKSEKRCPHCGTKSKSNIKKYLLYGFGGFILLSLISNAGNENKLGDSNRSNRRSKAEHAANTNKPKSDYLIGQEFVLGDYKYVIKGFKTYRQIGRFLTARASKGALFLVISYTIENNTDESQVVLSDDFVIQDSLGRKFKPSSDVNTALLEGEDKDFILSELQPGIPRRMNQGFEIPEKAIADKLTLIIPKKGIFSSKEVKIILDNK